MNVSVLVPFKAPGKRKSRLQGCLNDADRHLLSIWMLERVLQAVASTLMVRNRFVVGDSDDIRPLLKKWSFRLLPEFGQTINETLEIALDSRTSTDEHGCLIVPADIPLIVSQDVEQIIHLGLTMGAGVIVPNGCLDGTNGLFILTGERFPLAFGPHSMQAHLQLADRCRIPLYTHHSTRMALDVDVASDLAKLKQQWPATERTRFPFPLS